MKKVLVLILSAMLILSLVGCGEQTQPDNHKVEIIEEFETGTTNESSNYKSVDSNADDEIASKDDIVNYLKDDYCSGITFNESPQSDGRVFYTSTDGNKEVLVFSDFVTYYDTINDLDIGFYFDGFVDDSQKLRIKVTDGMFGDTIQSSEYNAINKMVSMLEAANVKEEISAIQIKIHMQIKDTLPAMRTYEYQYSDDILFILEECLDEQGQSVTRYNLYCDIF